MDLITSSQRSRARHPRLVRLPVASVLGRVVPVAVGRRARLLGLAGIRREDAGGGLLIPGCRSVHTLGMRFPLDLVFLDAQLRPVSVRRRVAPRRVAAMRSARAVLEVPASVAGRDG